MFDWLKGKKKGKRSVSVSYVELSLCKCKSPKASQNFYIQSVDPKTAALYLFLAYKCDLCGLWGAIPREKLISAVRSADEETITILKHKGIPNHIIKMILGKTIVFCPTARSGDCDGYCEQEIREAKEEDE